MRISHALWVIALSIVSPGCALIEDGARNTYWGVCSTLETHREKRRNRQWAEAAWQEACVSLAPGQRNGDYAQGFKDGYAEYLFRGGDGEPPLIAPLRYRHLRYQTADGYRAVESWFEGYRHGAGVARDSGARRWVVGPSALQGEWHEPEPAEVVRTPAPPLPPITSDLSMPAPPTAVAPPPPPPMIPPLATELPRENELRVRTTPVVDPAVVAPPAPAGITIVNEMPEPALPLRAKIIGVNEPAPQPPERVKNTNVTELPQPALPLPAPERAKITNVFEPPPMPPPEPPPAPPQPERVRITNVIEPSPAPPQPEPPAPPPMPPQPERARITNVIESPPPPPPPPPPERARIINVNEAPAPTMPERVRIKSVTVEPTKGQ